MTAFKGVVFMRDSEVRQVFLVYCMQQLEDGRYILLNRRYKPLGVHSEEWVKYEEHPSCFKLKRALSAKQVAALSHDGETDPRCIYFYGDGCIPTDSDAHWAAYSKRLQRLAAYDIRG